MIDALDAAGVTEIAAKRKCRAAFGVAGAVVRRRTRHDRRGGGGLWDAAEILAACNRAKGAQHFYVPECATITNPGGVDEYQIARLVAADGMRTHFSLWHRRTLVGEPTKGFAAVLPLEPNQSALALKALRTLADLGFVLMSTDAGRHVAAWTEHAYLPARKGVAA